MKIKLHTIMVGPDGCHQPGEIIEVAAGQGEALIANRYGEPVDEQSSEADPYVPWSPDGCSLLDALKRTADPDLWNAWRKAEQELAAAGGRPRLRVHHLIDWGYERSREASLKADRDRFRDQLGDRAAAAEQDVYRAFYEFLIDERLTALGANKSPSAPLSSMRAAGWKDINVSSWKNSVAVERTPEKARWYDIRVLPALYSPDAPTRLADRSLGEVFRRFVFADPEVIARAKRLMAREQFVELFGSGQTQGGFEDFKWPLNLAHSRFACQRITPKSFWESNQPAKAEAAIRLLSDVLADRLAAVERLLTRDKVRARGTVVATGRARFIDRQQWVRRAIWIDIRNGDLVEEEEDGRPITRWSGITLELPTPSHTLADISAATAEDGFHVKPSKTHDIRPAATVSAPRKLTALQESIEEAIKAIWPNGILPGLAPKTRDGKIIKWQQDNGRAVAGSKTIRRYLSAREKARA